MMELLLSRQIFAAITKKVRNNPLFFIQYKYVFLLFFATTAQVAFANEDKSYIISTKKPGSFPLSALGKCAPIVTGTEEYAGVMRAVKSLQSDIAMVTGKSPMLLTPNYLGKASIVIIGTLGKNPLIDKLVEQKKLNVTAIIGKWETFLIQVVENPQPGIKQALVIAGSDKRGTIFGIYDVSAQIGVSPWYWWADVPIKKQANLFVLPGVHSKGEPAVKYRGIFINDEAPAFSGWAKEKFGGFNHGVYERVFELILRLKGNYLWPAMWGNAFNDDDKLNPILADEYGVVMGTSHHEPMLRAQTEWKRFGSGAWNYQTNEKVLKDFWKQGIVNMGSHESIVTIGMRGDGDEPMTEGSNIALLERIVKDQRQIIQETTGKPIEKTPQLWALYKEVQDYYDKGMRVPDDVTLLLCDDNWGNIRKLPNLKEAPRAGGYGVYYHFDYVGDPRNYKWVNTNPITKIWEQMHLAHQYNANKIWIVNVGDIKPMEFPIEFFLDYAWDPKKWPEDRLQEYTKLWAKHQFGDQYAADIADIISKYSKYNSRRKPELLSPETFSLSNYQEAEKVVGEYKALNVRAEKIYGLLAESFKPAFFQLVLHPVKACSNLYELYHFAAKNKMYAQQERSATNDLAAKARLLFKADQDISDYYNKGMLNGKWNHMMDQTHIGYTYWQQPPINAMPVVKEIEIQKAAQMGVFVEGSTSRSPGEASNTTLPEFNSLQKPKHYFEIFNKGAAPFNYSLTASEPWIKLSAFEGKIDKEERITVDIDWQKAPAGKHVGRITISSSNGTKETVALRIDHISASSILSKGFVETDGYVSMEAIHYSRAINSSSSQWKILPDYGRTSSAVTIFPVTTSISKPENNSPRLEYDMLLSDTGNVKVQVLVSPTMDFKNSGGLKYAISFDNDRPQIMNLHANSSNRAWAESVSNNVRYVLSDHIIKQPGKHTLRIWALDPGVVLQKIVVDMGGAKPSYLGPPESFYR